LRRAGEAPSEPRHIGGQNRYEFPLFGHFFFIFRCPTITQPSRMRKSLRERWLGAFFVYLGGSLDSLLVPSGVLRRLSAMGPRATDPITSAQRRLYPGSGRTADRLVRS